MAPSRPAAKLGRLSPPTTMAADLLLALLLPTALLLVATVLLLQHGSRLPHWLERLRRHRSLLWNSGIGLIIGLSALRWLLAR
ncbi:hypothetical protein [Cyanobium sp. NS01]|uniref:hypothetical protein n=1 Tax=Cyanobium sp. NS01 TaxID=261284 RepID=UPI0018601701|nr:hypothetical protein [Cyanobium sp. NS01]QNI69514.1 putative membrane protein [Cyanobium sp. NS01]